VQAVQAAHLGACVGILTELGVRLLGRVVYSPDRQSAGCSRQAFLGHLNVTNTARYLNVSSDNLRELIELKLLTLVKN
jgi:hypothetical protein